MAQIVLTYPQLTKSIGGFVIDAFISENYSFSNNVTEIPVEEGDTITDNISENPDEIEIEGFIGNVEFVSSDKVDDESLLSMTQAVPDKKKRIRSAYQELLRLKRAKQPVNLVTGLDTYTDMVITDLSIPRDVETGADLHFTMTFRKLPIIRSETVELSVSNAPKTSASEQVQSTAKTGIQSKKEEQDSLLKQWYKEEVKSGNVTPEEYEQRWGEPFI